MVWTQQLYDLEDRAREMSADERRALRQREALPILQRMKACFEECVRHGRRGSWATEWLLADVGRCDIIESCPLLAWAVGSRPSPLIEKACRPTRDTQSSMVKTVSSRWPLLLI